MGRLAPAIASAALGAFLLGARSAVSATTEDPALARFGNAITFYLGFDHGTLAEIAGGKPEPIKTDDGSPEFHPGLYGRAMMLVGKGQSTLWYSALGNVDLTRPGSAIAWTCPRGWGRSDEEDYFFPLTILCGGAKLSFGRQGQLLNPLRRTDLVYLAAKIGDSKDVIVGGGDSLQWKNGEWHLWVMNWRSKSVEFSLDGGPPNRQELPMPFRTGGDGAGQIIVAAQTASCRYLLDEVIILNRPISAEEITWLYDEGTKQAQPDTQRKTK